MSRLLRAELLKLRTTRTFFALMGAAIVSSVLLTVLVALLSEPSREDVLVDVYASDLSSLFILVLAIVGITGEWRHRTIVSSLLAAPDRVRFLAAKTLAFAAAGLAISLTVSVAISIAGTLILSARDLPLADTGEWVDLLARNAGVAALLGAFGVGLGAIVRNQAAAIVGVLLLSFALEPVVLSLVPEVGRFGPLVALPLGITDIPPEAVGFDTDVLASGLATLAMLGWVAALFAAGAALLRARDLS